MPWAELGARNWQRGYFLPPPPERLANRLRCQAPPQQTIVGRSRPVLAPQVLIHWNRLSYVLESVGYHQHWALLWVCWYPGMVTNVVFLLFLDRRRITICKETPGLVLCPEICCTCGSSKKQSKPSALCIRNIWKMKALHSVPFDGKCWLYVNQFLDK